MSLRKVSIGALAFVFAVVQGGTDNAGKAAGEGLDTDSVEYEIVVVDSLVVDSVALDEWEVDSILVDSAEWSANILLREAFRSMPDSLLPTLTQNNRLDMIDFMDSQMRAEVTNRLNGKSEMTALADDSLSLKLSSALTARILLLQPSEPVRLAETPEVTDSTRWVICMIQTFGTDPACLDTRIDFYSVGWKRLAERPRFSDADEQRISQLNVQTFLNWDTENVKKIKSVEDSDIESE